jgi:hypothetical protein
VSLFQLPSKRVGPHVPSLILSLFHDQIIVDGNWCLDVSRPTIRDPHGNINNVIEVGTLSLYLHLSLSFDSVSSIEVYIRYSVVIYSLILFLSAEDVNNILIREINETYSLFYPNGRAPVECTAIKKIEQFSPELFVVHSEGREG